MAKKGKKGTPRTQQWKDKIAASVQAAHTKRKEAGIPHPVRKGKREHGSRKDLCVDGITEDYTTNIAKAEGIPFGSLVRYLRQGLTTKQAVEKYENWQSTRISDRKMPEGMTVAKAARMAGVNFNVIAYRMSKGLSLEQAIAHKRYSHTTKQKEKQ